MSHLYSREELEFLKEFASGNSYSEITEAFNKKFPPGVGANSIRACLKNHKINTGRTGQFEKGHVPVNKGRHSLTVGRMAETQFKKGDVPVNHKPVGSVSIRNSYKKRSEICV